MESKASHLKKGKMSKKSSTLSELAVYYQEVRQQVDIMSLSAYTIILKEDIKTHNYSDS